MPSRVSRDLSLSFGHALQCLSRQPVTAFSLHASLVATADAFHSTSVPLLTLYKEASCLCESQLRQIAQLLLVRDASAIPSTVRLLLIMHGLPGNDELVHNLLSQHDCSSLDASTLTILSFLAGPSFIQFCPISHLFSNAFSSEGSTSKLALCIAFNVHPGQLHEHVPDIGSWDTEILHSETPSFWRELKWAAFARSRSIDLGFSTSKPSSSDSSQLFEDLPSSDCETARHYTRLCGILMKRRRSTYIQNSNPNMNSEVSQQLASFFVTPSIYPALRHTAGAIAHGIPFVLEGPTGCGKTSLLSFIARNTVEGVPIDNAPGVTFVQMDSVAADGEAESFDSLIGSIVPLPEDGGFRWRPGPIGLAVSRGEWLVLENIGLTVNSPSAASLLQRLANLRVGQFLDAPGRGEPIRVATGFRCIATRTVDISSDDIWQPPGGWNLWLRVQMQSLSNDDMQAILRQRFPIVMDCVGRIVNSVTKVAAYTTRHSGPIFVHPNMRQALRICNRLNCVRNDGGNVTAEISLQETLDTLASWCSDERHCSKLVSIVSQCWSMPPEVGNNLLSSLCPSYSDRGPSLQIGRATHPKPSLESGSISCRLALNSHTLRLLERILRCLQMQENVLLTGEAGSGKTAVVQELARILGKELVIVNLSRQSELSDLLGGFKPVEMAAVVPQVSRKFEELFCTCMSKEKNVKFLDALQRAARTSEEHERALRLMKGAINALPQRVKSRTAHIAKCWSDIANEVESLERSFAPVVVPENVATSTDSQLEQSNSEPPLKRLRSSKSRSARRVEFRFSEGVLVKAMRAGKWILLDEINLAPSELLERLVSVVDNGQVVLSNENGDVISQKPGFMLFGAMNPPTDAGKRPLPTVLRTRFSELFVGDVSKERDVIMLILHRFFRRTMEGVFSPDNDEYKVAEDVAHFFLECCKFSREGRIEDTSGKPIRFSVRTLSRMLDFASGVHQLFKPGGESIRRALYEGALVAFATSLPKICKGIVVQLAIKRILRYAKASKKMRTVSAMMAIPINLSQFVQNVEGFPIEKLKSEFLDSSKSSTEFIVSPTVKKTLIDICRAMLLGAPKFPVLLQGPTAAGKTSLVTYMAELTGTEIVRINNHEHTELTEYVGGYVVSAEGALQFSEGPLVRAARLGHWVLLDELNLAPPDVLEALNRLLDDNREIFVAETGEVVKAAPGFRLFATQNPPGLYGGRKELSRAFRSRFVEVHVDELPDADLLMILEKRSSIPKSFAKGMVSVMRELQLQRRSTGLFTGREGYVTARDLFRWSSRQPRSREELAVYGFLLLAERARQSSEREVVRNVLIKELRVSKDVLCDSSLYSLKSSTEKSTPSQECLDQSLRKLGLSRQRLLETLDETGIVPTPHMCRMIVLILHCLANREPALLVGATGSGKTSCCDLVCSALHKSLLSVNCHRHTEASDIVGSFRPVRKYVEGGASFEWCNGPLIEAMIKGHALLVDEINMADDAVIERLNSVLEHGRSFLLSEKGSSLNSSQESLTPEFIVADSQFLIMATMNPGGDFGKKELSPALRNRFTEMWMPQPTCMVDYAPIVQRHLSALSGHISDSDKGTVHRILLNFLKVVLSGDQVDGTRTNGRFVVTLRDLKAWCDFIVNSSLNSYVEPVMTVVHGARLVFLDGLSVGSMDSGVNALEQMLWVKLLKLLPSKFRGKADAAKFDSNSVVSITWNHQTIGFCLEVDGFRLMYNPNPKTIYENPSAFSFQAPNTIRNTARLSRAMCVGQHPILLEGPPGGGKTALVAALASRAKFQFVRVNLSESTEMSDLVGSDAPGERHGTFSFHEGPLLKALKEGAWLLLDELNLASQSVLEGLNSVLDHRRSVFVPELNEEVPAHESFRVFGAQNPAVDGSGRRGLPKSFLNRFSKVWVEPPKAEDILSIISSLHPFIPQDIAQKIVSVLHDLGGRSEMQSVASSFGLRDALRWCDLLCEIGPFNCRLVDGSAVSDSCSFLYVDQCFDAVVLKGLSCQEQRDTAIETFEKAFGRRWQESHWEPSLRAADNNNLCVGICPVKPLGSVISYSDVDPSDTKIFSSRISELQALSLSLKFGWPTVLFSESQSRSRLEGRRLFESLAVLSGKKIQIINGGSLSNSDDFIGGYSQQDLIWIIRCALHEWRELRQKFVFVVLNESVAENLPVLAHIIVEIHSLVQRNDTCFEESFGHDVPATAKSFLQLSTSIVEALDRCSSTFDGLDNHLLALQKHHDDLEDFLTVIAERKFASFEWRKSNLLSAIENGDWIFLEDADQCPPSVLDRLNPLFERLPVSVNSNMEEGVSRYPGKVLLAEAPTKDDGSPVYLVPHPHFRMVFSVSTGDGRRPGLGLSRALLDRSLRIYLPENPAVSDRKLMCSKISMQDLVTVDRTLKPLPSGSDDGFTQFVRMRLFACLGKDNVSASTYVSTENLDEETVDSSYLSKKVLIPQTYPSDLILNARSTLLERDLCSLFNLESISSNVVDSIVEKALSFQDGPFSKESVIQKSFKVKVEEVVRKTLVFSAAQLVFLAASSVEDAKLRAIRLGSLPKRELPQYIYSVYEDVNKSFGRVTSLLTSSSFPHDTQELATSCGLALDPLYSLDLGVVGLLERQMVEGRTSILQVRAKHFRVHTLALQRLLELWECGERMASWSGGQQTSLFSQAKISCELQDENMEYEDRRNLNQSVLAYEIVRFIVKHSDQICEFISKTPGWHSPIEGQWLSILSLTTSLCELLILKKTTLEASNLFALLTEWASCWAHVSKLSGDATELLFSNELKKRASRLIETLNQAMQECSSLTMPKTEDGQSLEAKLASKLRGIRFDLVTVSEVDAIAKAVVTVRTDDIHGNSGLITTMENLVSCIEKSQDKDVTDVESSAIEHWTVVSRIAALNDLWKVMYSLEIDTNEHLSDYIQSTLFLMKCVQPFHLHAVFATQRLHWILDSKKYESNESSGRIKFEESFFSSVLRASCSIQNSRSSNSGDESSVSDGVTISLMKTAKDGSKNQFWDLGNSWAESLCAESLVICGRHSFAGTGSRKQFLLILSLAQTLFEGRFISSDYYCRLKERNCKDHEGTLTFLISTLDGILEHGGVHQSTNSILCVVRDLLTSIRNSNKVGSKGRRSIMTQLYHSGLLWLLTGILRLHVHFDYIESLYGMDPCVFSQSVLTTSVESLLEGGAKSYAIGEMMNNRLGGDHPDKQIPMARIKNHVNIHTSRYEIARRRMVDRPSNKSSFESYEAMVTTMKSTLNRITGAGGLLKRMVSGLSHHELKAVTDEIQMIRDSCDGILINFEIGQSMSHFRDLSTDFELSLSQCSYGFCSLLNALQLMSSTSDKVTSEKLDFFSDLCLFPRSAFDEMDASVPNLVKKCLNSFCDGAFLLGTTRYLVGSLLHSSQDHVNSICEVFDHIVRAWKQSLVRNEEETERKSSLHILREATNLDNITGSDVINGMEENEEADFVATFNPMTAETEEEMLGVCDETKIEPPTNENVDPNEEDSEGLKIDSNAFWELYSRSFPFQPNHNIGTSSPSSRLEDMNSLSTQFYSVFRNIAMTSEEPANVWNIICAHNTVQQFSGRPNSAFNFYKSTNISELTQASTALRSLLKSIENIQEASFKETGAHPVLEEVKIAIERLVRSCRANSPLTFVVVGIETILRKADEWHRLFASKLTRVDSEVETLSNIVLRWRKLEMSSWICLLKERRSRSENHCSRWFFLLYDVIINHSMNDDKSLDDWKKDVLSLTDQFLRSSPFGEFSCRVHMILSLSKQLSVLMMRNERGNEAVRTLKNIVRFYAMYIPGVEDAINTLEKPIYRKLDDFKKLVKWTATEDLGSAQKMSKEKNKYLEYYRLKAASEKTRRRLHKLCLEIDAVLRKPSYDYLCKDVAKIGLKTLLSEENGSSENSSCWSTKFSERIPTACELLVSNLRGKTVYDLVVEPSTIAFSNGLLSRVSKLQLKMRTFGKEIAKEDGMKFALAMTSVDHVRNVIKFRVPELRSTETLNVQKKQRSLVELLRALRRLGLSPFGFASVQDNNNLISLFSTSSPSQCSGFDNVADDLFITCVRQVRRLHEVYDARVRNTDVSKEEASKALSFSNQLLNQSSTERQAMWSSSKNIWAIRDMAFSLQDLQNIASEKSLGGGIQFGLSEFSKLKHNLRRLQSIGEDINVFHELLKSIKSCSKMPALVTKNETLASNLGVSLRKHLETESDDDLKLILKGVGSCSLAFHDVVDGEDVRLILDLPCKAISLHRRGVINACMRTTLHLNELCVTLEGLLSSVTHLSSANVLSLLLQPSIAFLRRFQEQFDATQNNANGTTGVDSSLLIDMREGANQIVENILLSTQRILAWAGVNVERKGLADIVVDEMNEDGNEVSKDSISDSHRRLSTFHTHARLSEIVSLLSQNEELLERSPCHSGIFNSEQTREVLDIQRTLGYFLRTFIHSILIPVFEKCARYHCQALSLLRTLSSLFVGLFTDGYCRPANETPDQIEGEDQEISGTGFGDAGDGDMSGAQNVSDQIEDEEQLIGLKEDDDEDKEQPRPDEGDNKEDGFEMATDFKGEMEDAPEQNENDQDEDAPGEDDTEKDLSGGQEKGKEVLNERLWGDEDERAENTEDDDKGGDGGKQETTDLVANEQEDDDSNQNDRSNDNMKTETTGVGKEEDGERDDTEGEEDAEVAADDQENDKEDENDVSKKKGTDGKPLGDGDEDLEEEGRTDEKSNEEDEEAEDDSNANGDIAQTGPAEHDQEAKGDQSEPNEVEEGKEAEGDVEMGADGKGTNDGDEEGDGEDEVMVGDSSKVRNEDEDSSQDGKENDAGTGGDIEDDVDDLDLGDISSNDGKADGEGELSETDDGDLDMDEDGDKGEGHTDEPTANDDDISKAMELTDGTATTTQAGGDGHQAFQANVGSTTNMNHGNDQLPEDDTGHGEGDRDADGQLDGRGTGEKILSGTHGKEDETKASQNTMQDPNPLRAMAEKELVEQWESILENIKQAKEMTELDGKEQGVNDVNDANDVEAEEFTFKNDSESANTEDKVALGAATDDQHKPLGVDVSKEEDEDMGKNDGAIEQDDSESDMAQTITQPSQTQTRNSVQHEDLEDRANEESGGNESDKGDLMEEIQEHPARAAASKVNDEHISALDKNAVGIEEDDDNMADDWNNYDDAMEEEEKEDDMETVANKLANGNKLIESLEEEGARELWRQLDGKVSADSTILCEELRLVLEATEKSGLGGGYRSGKRLNMRKVIEFVASDFRKDRIWMRRVKAERRMYDVMIAIDNSASMGEGGAGVIALEAVALITSALGKLEVGRVAVTSFGATTESVRDFDSGLPMSVEDGGGMLRHFTFSQSETDVVGLLKFVYEQMGGNEGGGVGRGEQRFRLVFVISDGHVSQRDDVRRRVRMLKEKGVLVALIIVRQGDGESGGSSILDVKRVEYDDDGQLTVLPYMHEFPVPFYVVVSNVRELPRVMAQSLRHWIEVASG